MVTLFNGTDAIGWLQLYDGNITQAAYYMYIAYWGGWFITILFLLYQFILFMKTRNTTLCFVTGIIFTSMYVTLINITGQYSLFTSASVSVIYILLVIELGSIIYGWLMK
jgi:hypothetical protein